MEKPETIQEFEARVRQMHIDNLKAGKHKQVIIRTYAEEVYLPRTN